MMALFDLFHVVKRDPYCRHVCAVSPFVIEGIPQRYPAQPYSFWVSVVEPGPQAIPVDSRELDSSHTYEGGGDGPQAWTRKRIVFGRKLLKAGAVDALNLGGNRFHVAVTNVKRFALWLHPNMDVDFKKPITIELVHNLVDPVAKVESTGPREIITAMAHPSLREMMSYMAERRDYGLVYHARIEVEVR
jgi:hypothetical protein